MERGAYLFFPSFRGKFSGIWTCRICRSQVEGPQHGGDVATLSLSLVLLYISCLPRVFFLASFLFLLFLSIEVLELKMKSSTIASVLLGAGAVRASLYPGQSNLNHTCQLRLSPPSVSFLNSNNVPETPFLSCSANAYPNITDSCCTETYGGLVLSTQFWDTYTGLESQGQVLPKDTWSLHGLWPDFCNGSYTGYCDLSYVSLLLSDADLWENEEEEKSKRW